MAQMEAVNGDVIIVIVNRGSGVDPPVILTKRAETGLKTGAAGERAVMPVGRIRQCGERYRRGLRGERLEGTPLNEDEDVVDRRIEREPWITCRRRVSLDKGRRVFVPSAAVDLGQLLHRRDKEPVAAEKRRGKL